MEFIGLQFKKVVDILEKENIVFSKKEIAQNLGLSQQNLSEILNGRNKIRTSVLSKFCKIYSINLYWLFYGEGEIFVSDVVVNDKSEKEKETLEDRLDRIEVTLQKLSVSDK